MDERAKSLVYKLEEIDAQDAKVSLLLLQLFSSFFKFARLARATPPPLSFKVIELFDINLHYCFSQCTVMGT